MQQNQNNSMQDYAGKALPYSRVLDVLHTVQVVPLWKIMAQGDNVLFVLYVYHFLEAYITDGVYWTQVFVIELVILVCLYDLDGHGVALYRARFYGSLS